MYLCIYLYTLKESLRHWVSDQNPMGPLSPPGAASTFRSEPRDLQSNAGGRSFMENPHVRISRDVKCGKHNEMSKTQRPFLGLLQEKTRNDGDGWLGDGL